MQPIKSELLRFITLRPVQVMDPLKRDVVFVHHPDPEKSFFLKNLDSEDIVSAREKIKSRLNDFTTWKTRLVIEKKFPQMHRFGIWLASRKQQITSKEILDKAKGINPLNEEEILPVWDQLFAQLLKRDNPTLRQACNSILIAQHFVGSIQNESWITHAKEYYEGRKSLLDDEGLQKKFVKRLANSKIVVPKIFSVEKKYKSTKKDEPKGNDWSAKNDLLGLVQKNTRAKKSLAASTEIKKEIENSLSSIGNRNKTVDEVLKDGNTGLSVRTKKSLQVLGNKNVSIQSFYRNINRKSVANNRTVKDTEKKLKNQPLSNPGNYSYLVTLNTEDNPNTIVISVQVPRVPVKLKSADLELNVGNKKVANTSTFLSMDSMGSIKTYEFFEDADFLAKDSDVYTLKGNLVFTNGYKLLVEGSVSINNPSFRSEPKNEVDETEENTDAVTTDSAPVLYGVNRIGMGIFRKVEQEVCCYVPGEVSHIENIMAREYKERATRNFTSTENTVEYATENEMETNTDTSSTVRNEMQNAVAEVISNSNQTGVGISSGVEGNIPGLGTFRADGSFDYAMTNATSYSDSEAQSWAQDITQSAATRVLQKTSEKRTSKIVKEFEEKIRHGYDNREGNEHVTGIYRWIDIIYTNRLINYGNMEMVEFHIPEPSRFYKEAILGKKKKNESSVTPEAEENSGLKSLIDLGIYGPEDIKAYREEDIAIAAGNTVGNFYQELANYYGVSMNAPKARNVSQQIPMAATGLNHKKPQEDTNSAYITDGYELAQLEFTGEFVHNPGNDNNPTMFSISAAGKKWSVTLSEKNANLDKFTYKIPVITEATIEQLKEVYEDMPLVNVKYPDKTVIEIDEVITGLVTANMTVDRTISYNIQVVLTSEITPELLLNWKTEVFEKLQDAYEAKLMESEANTLAENSEDNEEASSLSTGNTELNRKIEIGELKRSAIEMLTRPFGNVIGDSFIDYGKCDVNFPVQDGNWEKYSSQVKFFEQAFHWDIMAYIFYPYYWAERCDWEELMKLNDNDPVFESFLQSGMSRMVVPVRKGFEAAVNYYFETGDIWNGGDLVVDTDDELYLSIDEELEDPEGTIEKEWQTRVPTTLTLIQGDSAFLKGEGLPCCDKIELMEDGSGIMKSSALLGVVKEG